MIADVMQEAKNRMSGAITSLESDLSAYRTGRASTKLIEHLKVEQYGVEMQLVPVSYTHLTLPTSDLV